ncbi:MAG: TIGR00266 family protein [Thermonemataceae bacterium]|nr:TIGR00266 family protein [Thermonemataceae bacterium]
MKSHEIDYKIIGSDIQIVEVALDPSETVVAEAGAMLYMEDGVSFETKMGDGAEPDKGFFSKLLDAGKRMITGESAFMTHFTNKGGKLAHVAFSAAHPGTIFPVDLSKFPQNTLIAQSGSFLCAALGTKISIHFNKKLGAGLFGGEGFILQKLQGDGMAFLHAGGTIIERQLNNETLRVDTGCVVAFEPSIDFDIEKAGGLKSMLFGGEGLFLATLKGTGKVWLQSMPFSKLVQTIAAEMPSKPQISFSSNG